MKAYSKYIKLYNSILNDNELSINEKLLISIINDMKGAFNLKSITISEILNKSISETQRILKSLKNKKLIESSIKNGTRTIKANINKERNYLKIPLALLTDIKELNNTEKIILSLIMENDSSFITNKTISKKVNRTESQIKRVLSSLKAKNYIQIIIKGNNKREIILQHKAYDIGFYTSK